MNFRKVISGDPLAEMRAIVQRMEEARAQMSERERQQTAEEHDKVVAHLAEREERERTYQAQKAKERTTAEAYNQATPEEQARPFHEWLRDHEGRVDYDHEGRVD